MKPPQGAAAASFRRATAFSMQPEDIVCQCGAQLAYLLRPALNEPPLNGLETLAAESGTAIAGVCFCVRVCVNAVTLCLRAFQERMGRFVRNQMEQPLQFLGYYPRIDLF